MRYEIEDSLVVIPTANSAAKLKLLLRSLDISLDCVLLIDQGSIDNTSKICEEWGVNILQLGSQKNLMYCYNVALSVARARGKKFLYMVSSSVKFKTSVAHELMFEMRQDHNLAAVAPSRLIVDEPSCKTYFSSRAKWDLEDLVFDYDYTVFNPAVNRIEADFCHLSCALMRVDYIHNVGGFDERFCSDVGDAEICFRLRMSGKSLAYLQHSQIENFADSKVLDSEAPYEACGTQSDRTRFFEKHLGFGAQYKNHGSGDNQSWNIINRNLYPCMLKHGLIDTTRPELVFSHPGESPYDYLYTVWETTAVPSEWQKYQKLYKAVCAPSNWNVELLKNNGFLETHYVPLGVETDIFTPFGPTQREFDCPVYLWFARNQYRKGLDVILKVWAEFRSAHSNAVLVIMGHDVLSSMGSHRHEMRRVGKTVILDFPAERVYFRQVVSPLSDAEVALAYRSVDYLICTSRSEGFGFSIVEAMSCGTTPIFPDYSSLSDFVLPQSLCFGGATVRADYADKGFENVGDWWEPDQLGLLRCLKRTIREDSGERAERIASGLNLLRNQFTWRNTCFSFRNVLADRQSQQRIHSGSRSHVLTQFIDVDCELIERENRAEANVRSHIEAGFSAEIASIFADFDSIAYNDINTDVKNSGMNGLLHFIRFGFRENRTVLQGISAINYLSLNVGARRFIMQNDSTSEDERLVAGED